MCGFAGVVIWDEKYRVSRETLTRMAAAVAHRGPDGEGIFLNHDSVIDPDHPQVGLAFRRLAILDPDPRSDQPFTDGRRWLVFNGEIYNFRELKKELSILLPNRQWLTTGDTEVLLAAYAAWGEKCVEKLNGMFAFAVWDEVEKTLFLARDRMGQKPLYVAAPAWPWLSVRAFASEIDAIRPLRWFDRTPERSVVAKYLRYGYTGAFQTAYENCFALGTGWNLFGYEPSPGAGVPMSLAGGDYFDPNDVSAPATNPVDTTKKLVRQAVHRQLVSDVPLGVFLSGGVDSSIVAACARRHGAVQTFSIGFDDPRYDETEKAAAVARHLETNHHTFRVTPDAVHDLETLATVFGTPFGDSSALPTSYLARETRRHVKVALSGDGGDELFGGYDRYRAVGIADQIVRNGLRLPRFLGRILSGGHPKSWTTRLGRLLATLDQPEADRYDGYLRLFADEDLKWLWPGAPDHGEKHRSVASLFTRFRSKRDPVQAALAVDRITYLPDDLLTKVDRCSMLHGLEVRSPFMDHELVTFAAGLTTDQLLKGGPKRMLREAFADDLPAWVFKRKKMGFAVPIGDWFRGPLRDMLEGTLFAAGAFGRSHFDMAVVRKLVDEHQSKRVDHSQRLYALLMLELWWVTVNVARAPSP